MDPQEYRIMARVERTHPWFVNRRRLVRGLVRRFASHLARPRVLDAGSGTGTNLVEYERLGWAVGVELDRSAAIVARSLGCTRVAVGDTCRLPFADASFDLVISTDVIEHIADDAAALGEMRRVLAPAGRVILTTPAYSWAYTSHDRFLHHVRRYDTARLHQVIRRAGLVLLHHARYNVLLAAPVAAARWCGDRLRSGHSNGSDVGRPLPGPVARALDVLWHLEARLAERVNFGVGLTHLAVLAHRG